MKGCGLGSFLKKVAGGGKKDSRLFAFHTLSEFPYFNPPLNRELIVRWCRFSVARRFK